MNIVNMEIKDMKDIELVRETTSSKVKIKISDNLENKIRILASEFPRNEWSGVLFYEAEDKNEPFEKRTYIAIDALPMNIGYETYTKFCSDDMRIPQFIVENGYDDDDIFMGLIHSHPTFGTNASATDFNTIKSECFERGVFMSLIVNNEGTYSAYMSRKIMKTLDIKCKKVLSDFNGENRTENSSISNKVLCVIECFDVKVEKEDKKYPGYEDFITDIKELYKKSDLIRPSAYTGMPASYSGMLKPEVGRDLFEDFFESGKPKSESNEGTQFRTVSDLMTYYSEGHVERMCDRLDIEENKIIGILSSFKGNDIQSFTRYSISILGKNNISGYDVLYMAILESFSTERDSGIELCRNIVNSIPKEYFDEFVNKVKKYQMYAAIMVFLDECDFSEYAEIAKSEFIARYFFKFNEKININDDEKLLKKVGGIIKDKKGVSEYDLLSIVRLLYSLYHKFSSQVENIAIEISEIYYDLFEEIIGFDANDSKISGFIELISDVYDCVDSNNTAEIVSAKYDFDRISYEEVEKVMNDDSISEDERNVVALLYIYFNIDCNNYDWYKIYEDHLFGKDICVNDLFNDGING